MKDNSTQKTENTGKMRYTHLIEKKSEQEK